MKTTLFPSILKSLFLSFFLFVLMGTTGNQANAQNNDPAICGDGLLAVTPMIGGEATRYYNEGSGAFISSTGSYSIYVESIVMNDGAIIPVGTGAGGIGGIVPSLELQGITYNTLAGILNQYIVETQTGFSVDSTPVSGTNYSSYVIEGYSTGVGVDKLNIEYVDNNPICTIAPGSPPVCVGNDGVYEFDFMEEGGFEAIEECDDGANGVQDDGCNDWCEIPVDGVCGEVNGDVIYDFDDAGDSLDAMSDGLCEAGEVENFVFTGIPVNEWVRDCGGTYTGSVAGSCGAEEEYCGDGLLAVTPMIGGEATRYYNEGSGAFISSTGSYSIYVESIVMNDGAIIPVGTGAGGIGGIVPSLELQGIAYNTLAGILNQYIVETQTGFSVDSTPVSGTNYSSYVIEGYSTGVGVDKLNIEYVDNNPICTIELGSPPVCVGNDGVYEFDFMEEGGFEAIEECDDGANGVQDDGCTDMCEIPVDCAGVQNGTSTEDACGVCDDDPTNDDESCKDCAGILNGTSTEDVCGVCDDDTTNDGLACADCAGIPNGTATIDICGICEGTETDATDRDGNDEYDVCEGLIIGCTNTLACNYNATAGYEDGSCILPIGCNDWCDGDAGEAQSEDTCGVCGGDDSSCVDCAGVPNGTSTEDVCGVCDDDTTNDGLACADCAGAPNGTATIDICGICKGTETDTTDRDGNDEYDICEGLVLGCINAQACNYNEIAGYDDGSCVMPVGCNNRCSGDTGEAESEDACGVCGGDDSSCVDCAGVPNGTSTEDTCGVCDDNTTNDDTTCCSTYSDCLGGELCTSESVCEEYSLDVSGPYECGGSIYGVVDELEGVTFSGIVIDLVQSGDIQYSFLISGSDLSESGAYEIPIEYEDQNSEFYVAAGDYEIVYELQTIEGFLAEGLRDAAITNVCEEVVISHRGSGGGGRAKPYYPKEIDLGVVQDEELEEVTEGAMLKEESISPQIDEPKQKLVIVEVEMQKVKELEEETVSREVEERVMELKGDIKALSDAYLNNRGIDELPLPLFLPATGVAMGRN